MSSSVERRSPQMVSDDLDLTPRVLGQLPLQRALIRAIGIEAVIDEALPKDPRNRISDADCVVAMILNILSGRVALYNMPQFFANTDAAVVLGEKVPLDALNDARLAACLDHLFEAGTDSVLGQVVRRFLASGKGGTSYSVHADTTSLSLQGAYDRVPVEGAPVPLRGYSKDHRPDLKQLVFGLSLHGAVGIPLTASTMDGNTSDTEANRWSIEQLAGLLPPEHEATLVGDSKLLDAETIGQLLHEEFHFVSLVPHAYRIRAELVERVRGSGTAMAELSRRAGARKGDAEVVYRGQSFLDETLKVKHPQTGETRQVPVQYVVVRSDAQAEGFENKLEKRLVREEKAFQEAVRRANRRGLVCEGDAETARAEALAMLELQRCALRVTKVEEPAKRAGPGRPRKDAPAPEKRTTWVLEYDQLERNEEAVERARFHEAHYVLVTDRMDWDAGRILAEYRHQSLIEGHGGFRWIKNVALVAPVMLKTPHRIAALGLVFVLALMVRNYLQYELRRRLKETGETVRGRKQKVRTKVPTAETAMLSFLGVGTVLVFHGEKLLGRRTTPLPPDAQTVLDLLGIPHDVYRAPVEKWPTFSPSTSGM